MLSNRSIRIGPLSGLVALATLSACVGSSVHSQARPKAVHTVAQKTERLEELVTALSALCIESLKQPVLTARMTRVGFAPFHRKTKQRLQAVANQPVIWRKRFGEGHDGTLSVSNSNGACLGLYQNAAFDRQDGADNVAAGAEIFARFAKTNGYAPASADRAIQVYKSDPPAAFGQYEGPQGKVSIMVGYSPGEQILDGNTLETRLGGVRFLVVAGAQHI